MGRRNPFSPEIKIGRKAGLFSCRPSRAFSAALAIVFPGRTGRAASGPIMASKGAGRPCAAWLSGLGRGVGVGFSLNQYGSELKRSVGSESGCCQSDFRGRPFRRGVRGLQQASLFGKTDLFCHRLCDRTKSFFQTRTAESVLTRNQDRSKGRSFFDAVRPARSRRPWRLSSLGVRDERRQAP